MIWMMLFWLVLIVSVVFIGYGLFWDRAGWRGRPERRCRKCAYDLHDAGEVPVQCSECGRQHSTEKSLRRVRRHKKIVLVGLVMLLIAPVPLLYPDYKKGEVLRHAPNWLLVELMPFFPTIEEDNNLLVTGNNPGLELIIRLSGGREPMTRSQTLLILNRIASGGLRTKPGSILWQRRIAFWMRGQWNKFHQGDQLQYLDGTPADDELVAVFERIYSIYPEPNPITRDKWDVGMPVSIRSGIRKADWRAPNDQYVITWMNWEIEGTDIRGASMFGADALIITDTLDVGEQYRIRIKYEQYPSNRSFSSENLLGAPAAVFEFTRVWSMVPSLDEVFEGYDSPLITEVLIEDVVTKVPYQNAAHNLLTNPRLEQQEFEGLAMGMVVTLSDNQGVIREFPQSWMTTGARLNQMSGGVTTSMSSPDEQAIADERIAKAIQDGTLRVRLRGDFEQSLMYFDTDRAWDGEIDVLYSDALLAAESGLEKTPSETTGP
jgi:hypothetical protein